MRRIPVVVIASIALLASCEHRRHATEQLHPSSTPPAVLKGGSAKPSPPPLQTDQHDLSDASADMAEEMPVETQDARLCDTHFWSMPTSEDPCAYAPDRSASLCLVSPSQGDDLPTIKLSYPEALNEIYTPGEYDRSRFLYTRGTQTYRLDLAAPTMIDRDTDAPRFYASQAELDGDGREELLFALRGTYNTSGDVYMHYIVIDDDVLPKKPEATHLYLPQPDPVSASSVQNLFFARDFCGEEAKGCCVRELVKSFEGNGCGGCSAGGSTGAVYRTHLYQESAATFQAGPSQPVEVD